MEIPLGTPSLPLDNAPGDPESENYTIQFAPIYGTRIEARIYNENQFLVDIIVDESFQAVYNSVCSIYPQAHWRNSKEEDF